MRPRKIILLDHAEDNLFNIRRELEEDRHFGSVEAVLGDCKELPRMQEIFEQFEPEIVFHAAAYKHVALMQENPVEAIRNNAIGTRTVVSDFWPVGLTRSPTFTALPYCVISSPGAASHRAYLRESIGKSFNWSPTASPPR